MISIASLFGHRPPGRIVFDKFGERVDIDLPRESGPAVLVVGPMTDALKTLDETGGVLGSVDRSQVAVVRAIALDTVVLSRLEHDTYSAEDLVEAVGDAGFAWEIVAISDL